MIKVYYDQSVFFETPVEIIEEFVPKTKEFEDLDAAQKWCHSQETAHMFYNATIRTNGKFCRKANPHKFEMCKDSLCCGRCAYGEICPWSTWEYGPNEDFFPTEQECSENPALRAYVDPRVYTVHCVCSYKNASNEDIVVRRIDDAIKLANNKLKEYIRVSIERDGFGTLCEKSL